MTVTTDGAQDGKDPDWGKHSHTEPMCTSASVQLEEAAAGKTKSRQQVGFLDVRGSACAHTDPASKLLGRTLCVVLVSGILSHTGKDPQWLSLFSSCHDHSSSA